MSQITPTTSATTSSTASSSSASSAANTTLSQNQFLDLMMTELQNQDPLSPSSTDPTQYLSELAQFTSLEQETNTAQSTAQAATEQQNVEAVTLLGHTVNYTDSNGDTQTGTVQNVDLTGSSPTLTIGGAAGIDLGSVSEVS